MLNPGSAKGIQGKLKYRTKEKRPKERAERRLLAGELELPGLGSTCKSAPSLCSHNDFPSGNAGLGNSMSHLGKLLFKCICLDKLEPPAVSRLLLLFLWFHRSCSIICSKDTELPRSRFPRHTWTLMVYRGHLLLCCCPTSSALGDLPGRTV